MPGVIKNKIADMAILSWESLAIMLDNIITGWAERKELEYNSIIRRNLREIAERHLPFVDKIDELKSAVSALDGASTDSECQKLLDQLDKLAQQGKELTESVEQVKSMIIESGLSDQDKRRMFQTLDDCERSMKDYYCSKIPPYVYKKFMAAIRRSGTQADITVVEQANGGFVVFYPAQHIDLINNSLEFATLSYQTYPSPGAVERGSYMGAANYHDATVLKFDNISPELAEKAVEEARRYGYVNFAKERMVGTDPEVYRLICEGGSTQEERDRNQREAMEILCRAAISISGQTKETMEKMMTFNSNEYDKLTAGIESGNGYVFSVRQKSFNDNVMKNGTVEKKELEKVTDPHNFVRFSTDPKSGRGQFYTQQNEVVTTSVYESETERYHTLLYHTANSGLGQKVYLSQEKVDALKLRAKELYQEIHSGTNEKWATLSIQILNKLDDSISLRENMMKQTNELAKDLRLQSVLERKNSKQLSISLSRESREVIALKNSMMLTGLLNLNSLTEENIFYGLISEEIETKHKFHDHGVLTKESLEIDKTIANAVAWCAKDVREEVAKTSKSKLRVEDPINGEDFSIESDRLNQMIDRFRVNDYIVHESVNAEADQYDENGQLIPPKEDQDWKTVSQVQKEKEYLDQYYRQAADKAKDLLKDVRIHLVHARVPMEVHDLEHPYSKLVHMNREEVISKLENFHLEQDEDIEIPTDHTRTMEREKDQEITR